MIYNQLYLFLVLLCLLNPYVKRTQRYWPMYLGAFAVLCFQALRWKTGTDWIAYQNEFIYAGSDIWKSRMEPGFELLNIIVRKYTSSYTVFLFVECGLNLFFITTFLRKMPINNPSLGMLYFFVIAIFPIRYTLASNMVLCSYFYILEKRFIPFLLLVLAAFTIHRTVIAFLPLYFICQRQYSFKFLLILYFSCFVLGMLVEYTFGHILQMAMAMYGIASDTVQGKLEAYITEDVPEYAKMTPMRVAMSLINSTLFILFFRYFQVKRFSHDRLYALLFTLYVLGISFNRIFMQTVPDIARLTSLFTGGYIIMIIMIIGSTKRTNQIFFTAAFTGYLFLTYNSSVHGFYEDLFVPYYSIFTEDPLRSLY